MHTWPRLRGRLDRLRRIGDKIDLDRSGRVGHPETSERDRRLHVIDLQPGTTKPRFDLAWDLAELEQRTKTPGRDRASCGDRDENRSVRRPPA